jgi:hypothetical protein
VTCCPSIYPDFKRGETINLIDDLLAFEHKSNPSSTLTATGISGVLSLTNGRSETERQVMGAYGNTCDPRPKFINAS